MSFGSTGFNTFSSNTQSSGFGLFGNNANAGSSAFGQSNGSLQNNSLLSGSNTGSLGSGLKLDSGGGLNSNQTTFGSLSNTTNSLFSNNSNASNFGSNATSTSVFGPFGSSSNKSTGMNMGMNSMLNNNSSTSTNMGGGLFSNRQTPSFGSTGFGSNSSNTGFGTGTSFGAPSGSSSSGLFGGMTNSPSTNNNTTFGSGGVCGLNNTNSGGFGNTSNTMNNNQLLFGQAKFGSDIKPNDNPFSSTGIKSTDNAWGMQNWLNQCNGTGGFQFTPHVEKDSNATGTNPTVIHYQSISTLPAYQNFSFEELRVVDYLKGNKFGNLSGQSGAFGVGTGFGTFSSKSGNFSSTGTGLFGSNQNSTFGMNNSSGTQFGMNSSNSVPFGSQNTGSGFFGGSSTNNQTLGTGFGSGSTMGFGNAANNTQTGQNLIKPGGTFGQVNSSLSGTPSFGNSNVSGVTTTGTFGSNTSQTTSLFGATGNNNAGNVTNSSGGAFGNANAGGLNQPQNSLGTMNNSSFSLFGQNNTAPKPGDSLLGNNSVSKGLFSGTPNLTQQQQQPGGSSLFGGCNNTQSSGLFNKPALGTTGSFMGGSLGSGLGFNLGSSNNTSINNNSGGTTTATLGTNSLGSGGIFSFNQQSTGVNSMTNLGSSSLNGPTNAGFMMTGKDENIAHSGMFSSSISGGMRDSTNGGVRLTASLFEHPYGNAQLFSSLNASSGGPVGAIAVPLSGSQKTRKAAILPAHKFSALASSRFMTPVKSNGLSFSSLYSSTGTGTGLSLGIGVSVNGSSGTGGSLKRFKSLQQSLGKSFSMSNLRSSYSGEVGVGHGSMMLSPGALVSGSKQQWNGNSPRKLQIQRGLDSRRPLFGGSSSGEEVVQGSALRKKVSFEDLVGGEEENELDKTSDRNGHSEEARQSSSRIISGGKLGLENSSPSVGIQDGMIKSKSMNVLTRPSNVKVEEKVNGEDSGKIIRSPDLPSPKVTPRKDQTPGSYWMEPSLDDLLKFSKAELEGVPNFKVGREGCGMVEFGRVNLTGIPVDRIMGEIVKIGIRSLTVYGSTSPVSKPKVGEGLNVTSVITLENSWPRAYKGKVAIYDTTGPRFERHLKRLKETADTEFIDYDSSNGSWKFRVFHYSSYQHYSESDHMGVSSLESEEDEDDEYLLERMHASLDAENELLVQSDALTSLGESDDQDNWDQLRIPGGFETGNTQVCEPTSENSDLESISESSDREEQCNKEATSPRILQVVNEADLDDMMTIDGEDMEVTDIPKKQPMDTTPMYFPRTPQRNKNAEAHPSAATSDWAGKLLSTMSTKKRDRFALREFERVRLGLGGAVNLTFQPSYDGRVNGKSAPVDGAEHNADWNNLQADLDEVNLTSTMEIMDCLFADTADLAFLRKASQSLGLNNYEDTVGEKQNCIDSSLAAQSDIPPSMPSFPRHKFCPRWNGRGLLSVSRSNPLVVRDVGNSVDDDVVVKLRLSATRGQEIDFLKFSSPEKTLSARILKQLNLTRFTWPGENDFGASVTPRPEIDADALTFNALAKVSLTYSDRDGSDFDDAENTVWQLASILFDRDESVLQARNLSGGNHMIDQHEKSGRTQLCEGGSSGDKVGLRRREKLSVFWKNLVRADMLGHLMDCRTSEERALIYLSGGEVHSACAELVRGKNFKLASMVALLDQNAGRRSIISQQLRVWSELSICSSFPDEIRAIYSILAGHTICCNEIAENPTARPEFPADSFVISRRFDLDWRRAFGICLWFGIGDSDTLDKAVEMYHEALEGDWKPSFPVPEYMDQRKWRNGDDEKVREDITGESLLWNLLKLSAVRGTSIYEAFAVSNYSPRPFDCRVNFQLVHLFGLRGINVTGEMYDSEKSDQVCLDYYSSIVELCEEDKAKESTEAAWILAIFPLLHMRSSARAATLLKEHLIRFAEFLPEIDSGRVFDMLHGKYAIPFTWIFSAKALYASVILQNSNLQATLLMRAQLWQQAHEVLCSEVGPRAVIEENYDCIREIMGSFADGRGQIDRDEWILGGGNIF